jgi:hypothetical protein
LLLLLGYVHVVGDQFIGRGYDMATGYEKSFKKKEESYFKLKNHIVIFSKSKTKSQ